MGNKLNPLKTKHDIDMELDGLPYKLIFKPVNKHIQEKLNSVKNENKKEYEESDSKRFELKGYSNLKFLNDELLSTFTVDENVKGGITLEQKTKILLENIEFTKKISALEKEIKELDNDLEDVNVLIENYYKQMFEECVSGEDKVKFQKAIDDAGLPYSLVNIYLNKAVRATQEKK